MTTAVALLALAFAVDTKAEATARFADAPANLPSVPVTASAPISAPPPVAPEPRAPAVIASPVAPMSASPSAVGFTRRLAQSHLERAQILDERGDIAQALREYSTAIDIDSTFGEAYLRLGALRERMGDLREAELVYGIAVRLMDTRARALVRRSHLRRAAGLGADALGDLEAAVELDDAPALLAELARDYIELHAWSAALAVFRRIAARAEKDGDAPALEAARLEVRALRVLAAETDPTRERGAKHDWVTSALASIARR